jgi:type IV pilus assembly protein PilB
MSLIGEMLIKSGIIDETQLTEALERQKKENKRLGEILTDLGYISGKELIWFLSEQADMPFIELTPNMLDHALINRFPEKMLRENNVLPLYETDDRIYFALGDPTNTGVTQTLKAYTAKEIVVSGAEATAITQILDKYFVAQRLDTMLARKDTDSTILSVLDDQAIMEFNDRAGNVIRKTVTVNIEIRIRETGEGNHE